MHDPLSWALALTDAFASGTSEVTALRYPGDGVEPAQPPQRLQEALLEELPITLVFNGEHAQVLMATPLQADELALGFLYSEGLLQEDDPLPQIELVPAGAGLSVLIELPDERAAALQQRLRAQAASGSCGLCGLPDQQRALALQRLVRAPQPLALAAVRRGLEALASRQSLNQSTGTAHAAALVDADGHWLAVREDISRHCALDKLIGHARRVGLPLRASWVLLSSRASFELVQKATRVGVDTLVAVSGPSALAQRAAEAAGMRLVAFAREGRLTLYAGPPLVDRER